MNRGMKENGKLTLPKEMDDLVDKMEKVRKEKELFMQQVADGPGNRYPLPINQITREMLEPNIPFVTTITIPVGFLPYSSTGYITNFNFDTTDLDLYQIIPNIEHADANSYVFLTLKGKVTYNINIESFRPLNLEISDETEGITTFSQKGTVLVNKVLTYGNSSKKLPSSFILKWKVEPNYITSFDGTSYYTNSRKSNFYNLLNNPRIERRVNIPVILQFVPAVNYTV